MKATFLIITLLALVLTSKAQLFNTGQTLKPNNLSLGIEPVFIIDGPSDGLNVFVHGGYGLKKGIDFSLKAGIGNQNYFGGDVEWALGKRFSLTTGAHHFGDFGLDLAVVGTIPINKSAHVYLGCDSDIIFSNEVDILMWLPIGVEIGLSKRMSFLFEAEVGLTGQTYHIIGGGLNFYFN